MRSALDALNYWEPWEAEGGAIHASGSTIINTTIANCSSTYIGDGIFGSSNDIINSIVWNTVAGSNNYSYSNPEKEQGWEQRLGHIPFQAESEKKTLLIRCSKSIFVRCTFQFFIMFKWCLTSVRQKSSSHPWLF